MNPQAPRTEIIYTDIVYKLTYLTPYFVLFGCIALQKLMYILSAANLNSLE